MLKITAIVSLVLIGGVWASSLSCDSCGSECMSACGTRHFRACCFNYLRKKRGNSINEGLKLWSTKNHDDKKVLKKFPIFAAENAPELSFLPPFVVTADLDANILDDSDSRYQFYDA